jgi:hypothetical protein
MSWLVFRVPRWLSLAARLPRSTPLASRLPRLPGTGRANDTDNWPERSLHSA